MKNPPIYLDYLATTPIDPKVIAKMLEYMGYGQAFGNPGSVQHIYGQEAAQAVANARATIANVINALPSEIIFTSGATESNNLAIIGAANFYQRKGKHLITMTTEHKSCLETFAKLERNGFKVTYLQPQANGLLNIEVLKQALQDDTILVSIMHVNNEIGVIQNIQAIGEILADKGIVFHVDAAQSVGKIPVDVNKFKVHLMSLSSHKNYGPKGVGALYIRQKPRIRIEAQSFGGGQENGLRSGTLATHQIVGMAEAFKISEEIRSFEQAKIKQLRDKLWNGIKDLAGIKLNSDFNYSISGIINFSFESIDGAQLLPALSPIAVSTMSACATSTNANSYVLKAIGLSDNLAKNAIRLCIGRFTTDEDVNHAIQVIRGIDANQDPKLRKNQG